MVPYGMFILGFFCSITQSSIKSSSKIPVSGSGGSNSRSLYSMLSRSCFSSKVAGSRSSPFIKSSSLRRISATSMPS